MKYLPLLWSSLWRKKVRTIFTLLSVFVAFLLFAAWGMGALERSFGHWRPQR